MNPKLYFISLTLIAELFLVVPFGAARSVSIAPTQQKIGEGSNTTNTSTNGTPILGGSHQKQDSNGTSDSLAQTPPSTVKHIRRPKREVDVDFPFDFFTNHLQCDLEQRGTYIMLASFPGNCIWIHNNRYQHEGAFRAYFQAQLEAFFFGQYYERLRRFELDPHTFDYQGVGF